MTSLAGGVAQTQVYTTVAQATAGQVIEERYGKYGSMVLGRGSGKSQAFSIIQESKAAELVDETYEGGIAKAAEDAAHKKAFETLRQAHMGTREEINIKAKGARNAEFAAMSEISDIITSIRPIAQSIAENLKTTLEDLYNKSVEIANEMKDKVIDKAVKAKSMGFILRSYPEGVGLTVPGFGTFVLTPEGIKVLTSGGPASSVQITNDQALQSDLSYEKIRQSQEEKQKREVKGNRHDVVKEEGDFKKNIDSKKKETSENQASTKKESYEEKDENKVSRQKYSSTEGKIYYDNRITERLGVSEKGPTAGITQQSTVGYTLEVKGGVKVQKEDSASSAYKNQVERKEEVRKSETSGTSEEQGKGTTTYSRDSTYQMKEISTVQAVKTIESEKQKVAKREGSRVQVTYDANIALMERMVNERFAKALAANPGDRFGAFVDAVTSFVYEMQSTKGYDFGKMAEGLSPDKIIGETPILKRLQDQYEKFQQEVPENIKNVEKQINKKQVPSVKVFKKKFRKQPSKVQPNVQPEDYYTKKANEIKGLIQKGREKVGKESKILSPTVTHFLPGSSNPSKSSKPPQPSHGGQGGSPNNFAGFVEKALKHPSSWTIK
jgi:hypothetical protein